MRRSVVESLHICGNCKFCIKTYQGCECGYSDAEVDYDQEACPDFEIEDIEDIELELELN